MSAEFDPYQAWLDLENKSASTTYYKILGLPEFESDKDRITAAADKAIRKIRSHKPGEHQAEWSKIIDELLEMKALLLDDRKKEAYDDDLRFADEFVRELEGGVKRDPAAAKVAATAAPKKTESRPVKHDPRYPPGMAPKAAAPPPPPARTLDDIELRVSAGPKPIDRKDSPFYPPTRQVDKAKPPAPEATPGATAPPTGGSAGRDSTAPDSQEDLDLLPPGVGSQAPVPQAAPAPEPLTQPQPTSYPPSSYPPHPQPGGYSQPTSPIAQPFAQQPGYPPQPQGYQPQGYAQPGYPQAGYQQPAGYPQPAGYQPQPGGYPAAYQPGYPPPGQPPMAGYQMPGQAPMQPGYGYGPPMAQPMQPQPMGYGQPMPGQYGMQPMAAPMHGAPMAMPISPQAYLPPTPAALDPMAPVAIPGTAVAGAAMANPAPLAMPLGQSPSSVMMPATTPAAIPVGTAVAAEGSSRGSPTHTGNPPSEPAKELRSNSATSAMLASQREKSSQQTLMFVGLGGLLLIVVAVFVFFAASGKFGNSPVASNVPVKGSTLPVAVPDKKPTVTVPPVSPVRPTNPPVKPEPTKPEPTKPEPTKPTPEITPMPEPPVPKPEPKPEPVKPEPTKPEPKPEPPKPEPKPEPPAEMPTPAEVVALGKALQNAKDAAGEFNFAEAEADLAKAEMLAKLPEHKAKLSRLKEVEGYVKQFHERLVQSATGMDGGESFKVGSSTIVGMIEANPKQVVLRIAGQNKTFQYADLPVGLAGALADMKLSATDPVSRVVKGAYVAVHRSATPDQLQLAKSWWEEATLGGADVSHLMPFLTDSYDLSKGLGNLKKGDEAAKPPGEKSTSPDGKKKDPDIKALLEGKNS